MKKFFLSLMIFACLFARNVRADNQTLNDIWTSLTNSVQNFIHDLNSNEQNNGISLKPTEDQFGLYPFDKISAQLKNNKSYTDTCLTGGYFHYDGGGIAYSQRMALCPWQKENTPYITKAQWIYYSEESPDHALQRKGESCLLNNGKWHCTKWIVLNEWDANMTSNTFYEDNLPDGWDFSANLTPSNHEKVFNLISVKKLSENTRYYSATIGETDKLTGTIDCQNNTHIINTLNGKRKNIKASNIDPFNLGLRGYAIEGNLIDEVCHNH